MNKYLSPKETGAALKYAEQTIYNMIHSGKFVEGVHYFRPTPRKILFSREAIIRWVEGSTEDSPHISPANCSICI